MLHITHMVWTEIIVFEYVYKFLAHVHCSNTGHPPSIDIVHKCDGACVTIPSIYAFKLLAESWGVASEYNWES